jgi:hypothetical protein
MWTYKSTPPYAFMALCLVKHRSNFTFYLLDGSQGQFGRCEKTPPVPVGNRTAPLDRLPARRVPCRNTENRRKTERRTVSSFYSPFVVSVQIRHNDQIINNGVVYRPGKVTTEARLITHHY